MEPSTVSVVIPTFNRSRQVCRAVESALAQTYEPLEVIVVDDGSVDDTRQRLDSYTGRIRYIYQDNKGVSAARNTGIRHARGTHVAILDSDDQWLPAKLAVQMARFNENPSLGLVTCAYFFAAPDGQPIHEEAATEADLDDRRRHTFRRLLLGNCVSGGSNAVIRRACLDEIGGFDERVSAAEDWDMWLRIAKRYAIDFVEERLTIVEVSPTSLSGSVNVANMLTNELRVLDKIFSGSTGTVGLFERGRAYWERYRKAALAYLANGKRVRAGACFLRALGRHPAGLWSGRQSSGLLVRVIAGDQVFALLKRIAPRRPTT